MSPASSVLASSSITVWVIVPAGTITHTIRGVDIFSASSASEYTPVVLSSLAIALTAVVSWSYTTHSCPPATTRRTMFAPIRPRPIIPSCILLRSPYCAPVCA